MEHCTTLPEHFPVDESVSAVRLARITAERLTVLESMDTYTQPITQSSVIGEHYKQHARLHLSTKDAKQYYSPPLSSEKST